jgi:hypothetical protein
VENSPSNRDLTLTLPALGKIPELQLPMDKVIEAEKRLIEAKTVNPVTYVDLEHTFNESYRDLKKHMSRIGYQIAVTDKAMEEAKADVLLDKYPEFLESNNMKKSQDNADLRKAFLSRDTTYSAALDRMNQLKALESNMEGKIKVMENVCRYMRKQMDLLIRSGLSNSNYYITSGKTNGE